MPALQWTWEEPDSRVRSINGAALWAMSGTNWRYQPTSPQKRSDIFLGPGPQAVQHRLHFVCLCPDDIPIQQMVQVLYLLPGHGALLGVDCQA